MDDQQILDELLNILEISGIQVRDEPIGGSGGGLCRLRGRQVFFLDTQASPIDCALACAEAVEQTIDIEKLYIKPQIRQFIERRGGLAES
jgi:hypothetical protein